MSEKNAELRQMPVRHKKRLLSAAGRQTAQPYGDFVIDGGVVFFGQIVKLYG